jgi:DNA polymerase sigma
MTDIFASASRPFFQSTEKMHLYPIDKDVYYNFAVYWMSKKNISISKDIFYSIYEQFDGHTWYMQYILNILYVEAPEQISQQDVNNAIAYIMKRECELFQTSFDKLTDNQAALLQAIAKEGMVRSINANEFIRKYNLKGTSSVNKALEYLINKELAYHTPNGYIVYNRFFGLWLKNLL